MGIDEQQSSITKLNEISFAVSWIAFPWRKAQHLSHWMFSRVFHLSHQPSAKRWVQDANKPEL
jgi:hypothetical protein